MENASTYFEQEKKINKKGENMASFTKWPVRFIAVAGFYIEKYVLGFSFSLEVETRWRLS